MLSRLAEAIGPADGGARARSGDPARLTCHETR